MSEIHRFKLQRKQGTHAEFPLAINDEEAISMSRHSTNNGHSENILYLVLHGLISLVDLGGNKGFKAFLLDMGKQHKYLVGDWLAEVEIPARKKGRRPLHATLTGVKKEQGQIDAVHSVVVRQSTPPNDSHRHVRAIISLPRPRAIYPFTIGQIGDGTLKGDLSALYKQPTHLAGILVFEYAFKDKRKVALKSGRLPLWLCPAQLAKLDNINLAVLHIYDQPGVRLKKPITHTRDEFKLSSGFLGVNLTLEKDTPRDDDPTTLPGLLDGEVECLSKRPRPFVLDVVNQARGAKPSQESGGCGSEICAACNGVVIKARSDSRAEHKKESRKR